MASEDIQGIRLTELADHIVTGLRNHSNNADGRVEFDPSSAALLTLTPEKRNAARSESRVKHLGTDVGKLVVIAFRSGDGTGDPESLNLYPQVARESYLRVPQAAPRKKTGVYAEALFPLVQYSYEKSDPIICGGDYEILGLNSKGQISSIGYANTHLTSPGWPFAEPQGFLTCGSPEELEGRKAKNRLGDPHAIYSAFNGPVQVAAFLAVEHEHIAALVDLKTTSILKKPA